MINKYYLYFLFLSIFSYNVVALDGYVKTSFSYADKAWDFPTIYSVNHSIQAQIDVVRGFSFA